MGGNLFPYVAAAMEAAMTGTRGMLGFFSVSSGCLVFGALAGVAMGPWVSLFAWAARV